MISLPLSDMDSIYLELLFQTSLVIAIPTIDNGMGKLKMGNTMPDFAVLTSNNPDNLTGNNLDNLPSDFTICSSLDSQAFLGHLSPFLLQHQDGEPWISIKIDPAKKHTTRLSMVFFVSFCFNHIFSLKVGLYAGFRWTEPTSVL